MWFKDQDRGHPVVLIEGELDASVTVKDFGCRARCPQLCFAA